MSLKVDARSELNEFLKKYANQNFKRGYSVTFVATEPESKVILVQVGENN